MENIISKYSNLMKKPTAPEMDPALVAPEMSEPSEESQMSPEDMQADLDQLMSSINDKMNQFNGGKIKFDSELVASQNEAIAALFDVLEKNGIDASDPNAITEFLKELQQENPEGYKIFEDAINSLLSQKETLDKLQPPDGFDQPMMPMEEMIAEQPISPEGIPSAEIPIPTPIPQSMNQPNAQAPAPAPVPMM